jgi:hypothetical protein
MYGNVMRADSPHSISARSRAKNGKTRAKSRAKYSSFLPNTACIQQSRAKKALFTKNSSKKRKGVI